MSEDKTCPTCGRKMMSSGIICIHCGKAVRHLEIDKNQLKSLHKSEKKRYEIQVKKINVILLFIAILIMSVSIIPLIGYEEIFESSIMVLKR